MSLIGDSPYHICYYQCILTLCTEAYIEPRFIKIVNKLNNIIYSTNYFFILNFETEQPAAQPHCILPIYITYWMILSTLFSIMFPLVVFVIIFPFTSAGKVHDIFFYFNCLFILF